MEVAMEDVQEGSENDMSFEFTGLATVIPFNDSEPLQSSSKRTFNSFSDDLSSPQIEQRNHTTQSQSQLPTLNDYPNLNVVNATNAQFQGQPQTQPQVQPPTWLQWGLHRGSDAVHFTSALLQAVYRATTVATVPVTAAKRRLVSVAADIPAPAPVRRVLSSRRNVSRLFRQNHSPLPGQRSTSPITPPRFRPAPLSPFHVNVPGSYPVSPERISNHAPFTPVLPRVSASWQSNAVSPERISSHAPSTPTPPRVSAWQSNAVSPERFSSHAHSTPPPPQVSASWQTYSSQNDTTKVPFNTANSPVAETNDEIMDDNVHSIYEPLSPFGPHATPTVLHADQESSIKQLEEIRNMFEIGTMSPEASPNTSRIQTLDSRESIELTRSSLDVEHKQLEPLPNTVQQEASESRELIESTRSSLDTEHNSAGEHHPAEALVDIAHEQVQASRELIESTRSSLDTEHNPGEGHNSAKALPYITQEQAQAASELIESTRSSLDTEHNPGEGHNSAKALPYITQEQAQASSELIESTRSSLETKYNPAEASDSAQMAVTNPIESTGMTELLANAVHQEEAPKPEVSPLQRRRNTILKISKYSPPEKDLFNQLLAKVERQKARKPPLHDSLNRANLLPRTPINKSARFLDNPVTRTKKYVIGERISYPSPHSSRDDSTILSESSTLSSLSSQDFWDMSPTRQEEEAMIANQLMVSTPDPFVDNVEEQAPSTPAEPEAPQPSTPPGTLDVDFERLNLSGRRWSRRTYDAEKRRLDEEAIAEAEQARKDQIEAEEKARKEKIEAEEKARLERIEAEEKARKEAEEEEERQKKKLRMPVGNVIEPLTAEWEEKVATALAAAQSRTVAHTSSGTAITRRDIGKVLPQRGTADPASGWLNDTIIDAYLQAVVDHGNEAAGHKRGETPKFHAFSNFFYNNLREGGVDKVKRWASRAKIAGKDLLKVEWVFVPINQHGSHWTLIAISPTRKTIEYYDSFNGRVTSEIRNIKAWLRSELRNDYKDEEWTVAEDPALLGRGKGPRQANGSDCGVFCVTTAKMISLGVDPMAVSASDMPTQRMRLVAELINGGFTDEFKPNIRFE
ncbi:hypothetical protein ACLMJK_003584 [Lecanora helva]